MKLKKAAKSAAAIAMSLCMLAGGAACNDQTGGSVSAALGVARSSDKILQSYAGETAGMVNLREKFMGSLTEDFSIVAVQNEYESKQIIITPETDVARYYVTVGEFKKGSDSLPASAFEVSHEYYHEVATIYDTQSEMQPGMYPDALLPMETADEYGLNTIRAGENQGVYITVKIPKGQAPGVYTGEISVDLDGDVKKVSASITVLDYELPDKVSLPTCIPLQVNYLFQGELSDSQEMYDLYSETLLDYRLAVMYPESYYCSSAQDTQYVEFNTEIATEKALKAAKDERVSAYAIKVYEFADAKYNYVLNQELFLIYLQAYIDKSVESGVNLFEKAYVYMGNIIDEPDLGGAFAQERANYVCRQYEEVLLQAEQYARSVGASRDVIDGVRNLPHVVTGAYSDKLPEVQTYCPTADILSTSATIDDYRALREQGKDYWWYTCTQPKIPYPSYHIDDNGVSSRVMFWMMKEYDISGYLTWELAYYIDGSVSPAEEVKGMDNYDNVHRWGDAYGDGWLVYPGAPFGIEGPVPSIRLHTMRDGLEEYEMLTDIENMYAALSQTYGAEISADGILTELYASLYNDNRVYCSSEDVDNAKILLAKLAVLAKDGVAVDDYSIGADGTVSADVYAPEGVQVTINGQSVSGTPAADGTRYTVSSSADTFSLAAEGTEISLASKTEVICAPDVSRVSVYDENQEYDESASVSMNEESGGVRVQLKENSTRLDYRLDQNAVTSDTKSLIVFIRYEGAAKMRTNISLYGNALRVLDAVYLENGMNALRFDRIGDFDWSALRRANSLVFTFSAGNAATLEICGVLALN